MNKTALFITFAAVATVGLVGLGLIYLQAPEQAPGFIAGLVTVLGLVSASATTFYMLGKQDEKLEVIKTNTNGNLSRLQDENAALRAQIAAKESGSGL